MFGLPGLLETLVVLFLILLLFGHRLPGAFRSIGKCIVEFKKGLKEPQGPQGNDDEQTR